MTKMTRLVFILIFLFTASFVVAQQVTLYGKVVNGKMEPIKHVSIGILGKAMGTVSDNSGAFMLRFDRDLISVNDSLKFSIIGYHSKCILYKKLDEIENKKNSFVVVLIEKTFDLAEVVITSKKRIFKTIGTHQKSLMNLNVNFALSNHSNQNLGSEIGRKFLIKKKNTKIERLRFYVSQNNFDSVKFRFNIYSIKRGKPEVNLLNENIYHQIKNRKTGWVEIDLTKYGILVSENIIASLEWISKSKGNVLCLPIVMPTTHVHFYKYGSQNSWKRYDAMSTFMELEISE